MGQATSTPAENISPETTNSEANTFTVSLSENERSSSRIRDGIFKSLHNFWQRKERTDLVVIVENEEVKCHSFILCACSRFFAHLLQSRNGASTEIKVYLQSCSKSTFETILDILYTGTNLFTVDNIIDIWHASHDLEISFLLTECEDHVLKHLTLKNFAELNKHAALLGSIRVSQATYELVLKSFDVYKESHAFLDLGFEDLMKIVDSPDLVVSSEDVVIDAILKWVRHVSVKHGLVPGKQDTNTSDAENGGQLADWTVYLDKLFSASRLFLVSPDCLDMLMKCEIVHDHKEAKVAVDRALSYQLKVTTRHIQSWPSCAVHRNSSQLQNIVLAGRPDGSITVLSLPNLVELNLIKPSVYFYNCYISMIVFDNTVYALASQTSDCILKQQASEKADKSQHSPKTQRQPHVKQEEIYAANIFCKLYNLNELHWEKIADIPGAEHILVPHGASIYFIQPITKKVLKLDHPFKGNVPENIGDVPSAGQIVSCLPLGSAILIFCPKSESLEEETTVHCLDTLTKTWSRLNNLRGPAQLVSFRDDKDSYILQKNGVVSRIVDTHGGKVYFKSVGTFWCDQQWVAGCVRLGKSLFICRSVPHTPAASSASPASGQSGCAVQKLEHELSLTGVTNTKYLDHSSDFFLPAILERRITQN